MRRAGHGAAAAADRDAGGDPTAGTRASEARKYLGLGPRSRRSHITEFVMTAEGKLVYPSAEVSNGVYLG